MTVRGLVGKTSDADLLREMIGLAAERLMERKGGGPTGAAWGERDPDRLVSRNGGRDRETRAGTVEMRIPRLWRGSYFPGILEPRRMAEKALTAAVREACIHGVSTRPLDNLVKALGMSGVSRSQVSRPCAEIDKRVTAFLTRPLEGARPCLWSDATCLKVRRNGHIMSMAVIVAVGINTDGRRGALGFRKLPARRRHHARDPEAAEAFKKVSRNAWRRSAPRIPARAWSSASRTRRGSARRKRTAWAARHCPRTNGGHWLAFGAICPAEGKGAGLVMPFCDTPAMQAHLAEIDAAVAPGAHAVLTPDQAGWHLARALVVPRNITILPLPPRAPELNPSRTTGSSCATTGSRTGSSRATTTSRGASDPSAGATWRKGSDQCALV